MASERENLAYGWAIALRLKALWPSLSPEVLDGFRRWMQTGETPDESATAELLATGAFELRVCGQCRRPHLVMLHEPVQRRARAQAALAALGDG